MREMILFAVHAGLPLLRPGHAVEDAKRAGAIISASRVDPWSIAEPGNLVPDRTGLLG